MKGFAALCVVLGHVANVYYDSQLYPDIRGLEYVIDKAMNAFHMFFFMMISGYLYQAAYVDKNGGISTARLRRQMLDMLSVYVLYSLFWGISRVVFGQFAVSQNTFADILLIGVKPLGPYWYLYILVIYYSIYSHKMLPGNRALLRYSVLVLLALASLYINCPWFALPNLLYYLIAFDLGIVLQNKSAFMKEHKRTVFVFFVIGVLLLVLELICQAKGTYSEWPLFCRSFLRLFTAMGVSLGLWSIFQKTKDTGCLRLFSFIGRHALEIYVLHLMVVVALKVLLPRIGVSNGLVALLLNFILGVLLPIAFSLICKYMGIHGLFFRPVSTVKSLWNKERKSS